MNLMIRLTRHRLVDRVVDTAVHWRSGAPRDRARERSAVASRALAPKCKDTRRHVRPPQSRWSPALSSNGAADTVGHSRAHSTAMGQMASFWPLASEFSRTLTTCCAAEERAHSRNPFSGGPRITHQRKSPSCPARRDSRVLCGIVFWELPPSRCTPAFWRSSCACGARARGAAGL